MRRATGSSRREQTVFNSMQAFPGGLGEGRVRAHDIANHLPRGEVERAFGRRAHGQRDGALRTETDALRRRLLARPHAHGLGEQEDGYRFLSGLKLATTAEAIQVFQGSVPNLVETRLAASFIAIASGITSENGASPVSTLKRATSVQLLFQAAGDSASMKRDSRQRAP